MKRTFCLPLLLLFLLLSALPLSAIGDLPRLVDAEDLLTAEEEAALLSSLDEKSDEIEMDLVVVTTPSFDGKSARDYADDFFDQNGYGYGDTADGILFLVSLTKGEWYLSACGRAMEVYPDPILIRIEESVYDHLANRDFADAFQSFVDACVFNAQIVGYDGYDYDYNYGYDEGYYDSDLDGSVGVGTKIVISLILGVVIALLLVTGMKSQLKSVRFRSEAGDYLRLGSLLLTEQRDLFLYRNITRTPRQTNNNHHGGGRSGGSSMHRSSSGRSHSGRGGRF